MPPPEIAGVRIPEKVVNHCQDEREREKEKEREREKEERERDGAS